MLTTSGSSALSAWLFLITSATTIYRSTGQPLQLIACSQPDSFTVQITENENVVVYGTELLIKYNPRHVGVYPFPGIDAVNVVYNESTIEFKGYMSSEYPVTLPWISPERLSWISSGVILGTGTLQKLSREDYTVQECRLFLPKNISSSDNLPFAVKYEIAKHARNCMEKHLCKRLEPIKTEKLQNNTNRYHKSRPGAPASYAVATVNSSQQNCALNAPNLNINEPVDFAIRTIVTYIKHNNKSRIMIPDVNDSHNLGPLGMKCYFEAINGSFEDLSSLKRTEDAYISNVERLHVIKLGLGLAMAKFHYDYYKVRYGLMRLSGEMTGIIDGLALSASLVFDYEKECFVALEYLKVTEFGDIKIQMTGLGPINSATSKMLSWLTNMYRNNIVNLIEINAKHAIEEQLKEYACASYISMMFK